MNLSTELRFSRYVRKSKTGCHIWVGSKSQYGYGKFYFEGKDVRAHRVSWILTKGKIAENCLVLHKCDNPSCVNPNHLFLGTQKDNMQDMINKGRNAKARCHILSESGRKKISDFNKGKILSEETRLKMSLGSLGKIISEETRRKLSELNKGKTHSEETKRKLSESGKGRICTDETRIKLSNSAKFRTYSEETRLKMSESQKRRFANKSKEL
jgi:hypothetical protein